MKLKICSVERLILQTILLYCQISYTDNTGPRSTQTTQTPKPQAPLAALPGPCQNQPSLALGHVNKLLFEGGGGGGGGFLARDGGGGGGPFNLVAATLPCDVAGETDASP